MSFHKTRLKKIAVTGGIGAGKSSLTKALSDLGYAVFDADRLVERVVFIPEVKAKIIKLCGDEAFIENNSGEIEYNRHWLRDQVFMDPPKRKTLESIIHPVLFEVFDETCSKLQEIAGGLWVFYEAALIFESSREGSFDAVVSVVASEDERRKRLKATRSLSDESLDAIFAAQVNDHVRRSKSNFVFENNDTKDDIPSRTLELVSHLRQFFHPKTH